VRLQQLVSLLLGARARAEMVALVFAIHQVFPTQENRHRHVPGEVCLKIWVLPPTEESPEKVKQSSLRQDGVGTGARARFVLEVVDHLLGERVRCLL
jgi:hypothetical protein